MGGVHACMAAGLYPDSDLGVVPLLAPRSAAVAYCDGAMRVSMAAAGEHTREHSLAQGSTPSRCRKGAP
jgi:hypothetical protein